MRHRLSGAAYADLRRIYRASIRRFGSAQADRYLDALNASFERIARTPEMAPLRENLRDIRILRRGSHHIFYQVLNDEVLIVRVLHGAQDHKRHLPS